MSRRIDRRRFLRTGVGLAGVTLLSACSAGPAGQGGAQKAPGKPAAALNDKGWPTDVPKLSMGFIPLEDQVQQKNNYKPLIDHVSSRIGVPVEMAITTSYAALVEAQRAHQVVVGYHGALSFLFAEQQFGAIPIMVDSQDGANPAKYNSLLLAGRESPVKTMADVRGKDFAFVDPASTSGNLFPRVMLLQEGIDPEKDIKGRYAGNHQNAILAIAKGQVPCGASNNLSTDSAVSRGVISPDELVVLKVSDDIPNGPFTVHPELDPRAIQKIQEVFGEFRDLAALKAMELAGPMVPVDPSKYNFVREAAKVINLQFDEKGVPKPVGA